MNGPRHYSASEKLLAAALTVAGDMPIKDVRATIEMAQVHATLALAAATAMAAVPTHPGEAVGMIPPDFIAWQEVAGVQSDGES